MRPSLNELQLVDKWIEDKENNDEALLCIRDNRKYTAKQWFPSNLLGGDTTLVKRILGN